MSYCTIYLHAGYTCQWFSGIKGGGTRKERKEYFRGNGRHLHLDYSGGYIQLSKLIKLYTVSGCSLLY